MRPVLLAALTLLVGTPSVGQAPEPPGSADAARVLSGRYKVDSAHTQLLFTVNHLGFTEYTGQFTMPTGTLAFDTKTPSASRLDVTFPIDKVQTTVPALDTHLKAPDFFDAAKFPEGRFVSTRIDAKGSTATITGNLTLKGVTKPVILQARFVGAGPDMRSKKPYVGFAATGTIRRSDFGISYGVPMVSDTVKLTINAGFEQE